MNEKDKIKCEEHGDSFATFVCKHLAATLNTEEKIGFYQAYDPGNPAPNAWCKACEKKRVKCKGWNDESEAFAGVTMICSKCYLKLKQRNDKFYS